MVKISIEVPAEILERLSQTFIDKETEIGNLAIAALDEWSQWLNGEDRPTSLSEVETKRIYRLYQAVLINEIPTVRHIGEHFNLPLGRSRYIVQNLNYRYPHFMSMRILHAVRQALLNPQSTTDGLQRITLPKEASQVIFDAIHAAARDNLLTAKPSYAYFGDLIEIEMSPGDRPVLLEKVNAMIEEAGGG